MEIKILILIDSYEVLHILGGNHFGFFNLLVVFFTVFYPHILKLSHQCLDLVFQKNYFLLLLIMSSNLNIQFLH